jgi:hypothetical protein
MLDGESSTVLPAAKEWSAGFGEHEGSTAAADGEAISLCMPRVVDPISPTSITFG